MAQYALPVRRLQRTPSPLFGDRTVVIPGATGQAGTTLAFLFIAVVVALGLRCCCVEPHGGGHAGGRGQPRPGRAQRRPTVRIARTSWVLGSVLAAVAGVLYAPAVGALDAINLTFFVLAAYGAAVFGRLRSLTLTFVGGLVLGLVQAYATIEAATRT